MISFKLFPKWEWKFSLSKAWGSTVDLLSHFGGNQYLLNTALYPFAVLWNDLFAQFNADIKVVWWWLMGQADAIKLWLVRALILCNAEYKTMLKAHDLLKRDPRIKERKKPGLKKARKAPKRSKR